ncbi:hypothetical protein CEP51_000959 [Fusarium floridanum]|uniref:Helicase ATP-binding domain-containing protein n=1 Tax=Fusarium floridanum TaxID=1325733 RepID=A0A428SJF2_9HYPO|nr:hypothetical protein CEP51_000959 [Fusarium floridanum]
MTDPFGAQIYDFLARVPDNPEEIQPTKDMAENLSAAPVMFQFMRSFPKRFRTLNLNPEQPETQDLQEICGAVGIPDWEDLSMNEHQPLRTLEPSQVIDAFAVHQKVNSAPRCALLASECGSGKTNTVMAGIEVSTRIWQQSLADDSVRAPGLARSWKPTLWLFPSSILSQRFAEISDFWGGLFKFYCLYSQSQSGFDETVLRTTEELQVLLDHLAEGQSPASFLPLTIQRLPNFGKTALQTKAIRRVGLAITNDELSYLVLDEAHYAKNPTT